MIAYLLKSALCLLVLGSFYKLFLEKEKIHNLKRYYLILSIIFAFTIPLITFTYEKIVTIPPQEISTPAEELMMPGYTSVVHQVTEEPVDYWSILLWTIYGVGVIIFGFRFIRNLYSLRKKVKSNEKLKEPSHINVLLGNSVVPHTFLKYIFVSKTEFLQNSIPEEVLFHERAHVRQKHTLDILFVEVLQVIFWFNPLLFWMKKSMKLNHEFLADQTVLKHQFSIQHYINLLVSYPSSPDQTALTSTINYSLTKKRLQMMTKEFSKKRVILKLLAVLPVVMICVLCFNNEIIAQEKNNWVYSKSDSTSDQDKEITIRVEGQSIKVNGKSTTLENFANTLDEVTQGFKNEELKDFHFDLKLKNSSDDFVDRLNKAYRSTRLYKSNPEGHDLIPPPPPAPDAPPMVKKGEIGNIPPPPPPRTQVKKENAPLPPNPPNKASEITPPPPPKPPTKDNGLAYAEMRFDENQDWKEEEKREVQERAEEREAIERYEREAQKVLRDAERAEQQYRKNAIAGIEAAEVKHALAAEKVELARKQMEEARAMAAIQAEEARLQAEQQIGRAKETAQQSREHAMLKAEEARRVAEVLRQETEQLRVRERERRDQNLAIAREAQVRGREQMERARMEAELAREQIRVKAEIAREEAMLSGKLERERMKLERRGMNEREREKLRKELEKLESLNRKELEKARKKHQEAAQKLKQAERKALEKRLKALEKIEQKQG